MRRRAVLVAAAAPWHALAVNDGDTAARVAEGGIVIAFRHALAPGTFDPPGFRLGDCATQRNLSDEGRAHARRIGEWFRGRRLTPAAVRSSPWCRCLDTARIAFGQVQAWPALGSPRGADEATNETSLAALRRELAAATPRRGRFEVWVTHQFVLSALLGGGVGSGEGLLIDASADGTPRLLARLTIA